MGISINDRLKLGEIVQVGNKLYKLCGRCGEVIRINKPIIGSLHPCTPEPAPAPRRQI